MRLQGSEKENGTEPDTTDSFERAKVVSDSSRLLPKVHEAGGAHWPWPQRASGPGNGAGCRRMNAGNALQELFLPNTHICIYI